MFAISISYKTADTVLRQRYAFAPERAADFLKDLWAAGICEAVYLNTCNRCELYGVGDCEKAVRLLAGAGGGDAAELREYVLIYQEERAIRHLFRVTAGMESMVLGEDEILGQMKTAYEQARQLGYTAYTLNTVFQAAFSAAKKVKTDTLLSKSSVSVATIAADRIRKFRKGHRTVLVIGGSGDTGRKLMKNLISYGDSEIYATYRSHHIRQDRVTEVPYEQRYDYMAMADVIVSATKSPHYTVTAAGLKRLDLPAKDRLFVDLAVPRDIDGGIADLAGCRMLTIDEIEDLAAQNNAQKALEAAAAEDMLEAAADETLKLMLFHDFMPELRQMQEKLPGGSDFMKFVYRYRDEADARELASLIRVLRAAYGPQTV